MSQNENETIVSLSKARAEALGFDPEFAVLIDQLNQRFSLKLSLDDKRLQPLHDWFPVLQNVAAQHHGYDFEGSDEQKAIFMRGVEAGKAQALLDVVIAKLVECGVISKK